MYVILQKSMPKRTPKPKYSRNMTWTDNSWWKYSDPIERPIEPKWDIRIVEYKDGKKTQYFVGSLSYWEIADGYYDVDTFVNRYGRDRIFDNHGIRRKVSNEMFAEQQQDVLDKYELTENSYNEIYNLIYKKLEPLIEECLADYKVRFKEECKISTIQDVMRITMREEIKKRKAGFGSSDERAWQQHQHLEEKSTSNMSAEEKEMAKDMIKKGFRSLSHDFHPDKGGDPEQFKLLKRVQELLDQIIA